MESINETHIRKFRAKKQRPVGKETGEGCWWRTPSCDSATARSAHDPQHIPSSDQGVEVHDLHERLDAGPLLKALLAHFLGHLKRVPVDTSNKGVAIRPGLGALLEGVHDDCLTASVLAVENNNNLPGLQELHKIKITSGWSAFLRLPETCSNDEGMPGAANTGAQEACSITRSHKHHSLHQGGDVYLAHASCA
jgi:hypothetical protein